MQRTALLPGADANPVLRGAMLTAAMTALSLVNQLLIHAYISLLERRGVYTRTSRAPALGLAAQLRHSVFGWVGYMGPLCALEAAWPRPWSYALPSLPAVCYGVLALMLSLDCWYYFVHRGFHSNKAVFRATHALHHSPAGNLNTNSASYVDLLGGVLEGGLPMAALYAATWAVSSNFWVFFAGLTTMSAHVLNGHAGCAILVDHPAELGWLAAWPMMAMQLSVPFRMTAQDHESHHKDPRSNMAPFFTWLDDWFGTSYEARPRCSLLFTAVHLAYQAVLVATLTCAATAPAKSLAAYCFAYACVPPHVACALLNAWGVPQLLRRATGWLQDAYRRDSLVTYAPAGQPGSFSACLQQLQQQPEQEENQPVFVFACHPTGIISRSALLTFAACGWRSPVSGLQRVRLAVSTVLLSLPLPLSREALLAIGCVPADRPVLRELLQAGTSVAVAPGGWREPTHTGGGYQLLLKQRHGFVSLAAETGAALVPVLCLGEQQVAAELDKNPAPRPWPWFACWSRRLLVSTRPQPVQVVFGAPLVCQPGEAVAQLHTRYVGALQALAAQHGARIELL